MIMAKKVKLSIIIRYTIQLVRMYFSLQRERSENFKLVCIVLTVAGPTSSGAC